MGNGWAMAMHIMGGAGGGGQPSQGTWTVGGGIVAPGHAALAERIADKVHEAQNQRHAPTRDELVGLIRTELERR